ncbi:hypothetical protein R3P38DRAFT_3322433 [Favolaschia claudopus]|uniref:Uncharacterized protein n=1 Tax=Favolaschia claudopus TaxID=2862362 RepID=A0AAW0AM31_9AGAR
MSESEDLVNITEDLRRLVEQSKSICSPVFAPADVHDWISRRVESSPAPSRLSTQNSSRSNSPGISTNEGPNKLYTYNNPEFHLEYPETSEDGVGYLIRRDPENWSNPLYDSAYARGKPSGRTPRGKEISCQLLNDQTNSGQEILCQGAKCCPQANIEDVTVPHTKSSKELIKERLEADLEEQCSLASPSRDIFAKTAAFIAGIRKLGCGFQETDAPPQLEQESKSFLDDHSKSRNDELERIEKAAHVSGYGPLVSQCRTVVNYSTQRVHCPHDHRDDEGPSRLIQPTLVHLLVVSKGVHPHPIPLPQKTPPHIRAEVSRLLRSLDDDDLADAPMLMDLRSSLANREHLRSYITAAKVDLFPAGGTGWKGVSRLKEWQDTNLEPDEHYIRKIMEVPDLPVDEFDADHDSPLTSEFPATTLQIIICMSLTGSERLLNAQYIQSDIAFSRIEEFLELEMAAMDRVANTSVIFLRVYLNRQTAAAHQLIFIEIEKIFEGDTGATLQWRHLHANSGRPKVGFLLTKLGHDDIELGIGLHLQDVAQKMPHNLGPYDHLRLHAKRNIESCAVDESVRNLMRSLFCMRHPSWDDTVAAIQREGGKAGTDWVQDKIRCKFAFPAICWERSFIPEEVWKAGEGHTNLIESVHADVNREGVRCTLVGGIKKGQAFDKMKMRTLEILVFEEYDIHPSYKPGHLSENAIKGLKRKNRSAHKNLAKEDAKIEAYNTKLQKLYQSLSKACKLQRRSVGEGSCSSTA